MTRTGLKGGKQELQPVETKPARKKREKSEVKRQAIIAAAARIFKDKGYSEAKLSDIGSAAGTFAGSIYYHFASKDELVEEVLNIGTTGVSELVMKAVADLPAGASYRERITTGLRVHLSQMLIRDDFIVAYWRIIDQVPPELRSRHLEKPRAYGVFWKSLIQQAIDAGEIRPSVNPTIMRLVMIGSTIWALDWYNPQGDLSPTQLADEIVNQLFDGVGTGGPR